jgi:hypothetical protein
MPDYDRGFKIAAHHSGDKFCRLARFRVDEWEPIGDTLQTTERLADRAFRARQGQQRFVVYFEAYTRWTDDARWSILAKSGLLSERERLPTRTLVFILTPERYREQGGTVQLKIGGRWTQQVRFDLICMWRQQPQPWWEQVPGLMAMLPLTAHGRPEEDAVTYAARSITATVTDTVIRGNLLATLEVIALGRLEQARADVAQVLAARYGPEAAAEFTEALKAIRDAGKLAELHLLAVKCRGLSAFRRALAPAQS